MHSKAVPSDSFCSLPFVHQYRNTEGEICLCCDNEFTILNKTSDESMLDVFNSVQINRLREKMLLGKRSKDCAVCYNMEDTGLYSPRQRANEWWTSREPSKVLDQTTDFKNKKPLMPVSLDIRFSSKCALKCRTCNPNSSSTIAAEVNTFRENKLPIPISIDQEYFLEYTDRPKPWLAQEVPLSSDLKVLNIVGGEPLIEEENNNLLELVANSGADPEIRINTSFARKNNKLRKIIKNFSHVLFIVSLDGIGSLNDYIRHGSKFNEVLENIELNKENLCAFNTTVSVYNVLYLAETIEYISQHYPNTYHLINLTSNHSPTELHNTPLEFRPGIIKRLEEIKNKKLNTIIELTELDNIINVLKQDNFNPDSFQKFLDFTRLIDEQRGENIVNIIPDYNKYFK
jgi:MoaA/NifB/PqqE/SkfB family radical SAM enzyme